MLAAGAAGPEDLHADLGLVDLEVELVHHRPHLDVGEAGLATALVVERADAHQSMRASLGRHQPVRVATGDRELGRHDARLGTLADAVDLEAEAASLGPAAVHPQQDLGPVLGVDAAVFGVDLHDAVGLVVLAGEQAAQVELIELLGDRRDGGVELGLLRRVVDLAGQLVQHLGVFELAREEVELIDVGLARWRTRC